MVYHQLALIFLPLTTALSSKPAFQLSHYRPTSTHLQKQSLNAYGKGSEIWPECNEEPISLSASFPNGVVPEVAQNMLESAVSIPVVGDAHTLTVPSTTTIAPVRAGKRRTIKRTLRHLLDSAAKASSRRASSNLDDGAVISKAPLLLGVLLAGLQCVSVKHILSAAGVSIYLFGVACWCAAPKFTEGEVNMPSLPAKGHVPSLVSNPLGPIASSKLYRIWLRSGALLSLLLPVMVLITMEVRDVYNGGMEGVLPIVNIKDAFNSIVLAEPMNGVIKKLIGGHVFLVCCQALSEGVGRAALVSVDSSWNFKMKKCNLSHH